MIKKLFKEAMDCADHSAVQTQLKMGLERNAIISFLFHGVFSPLFVLYKNYTFVMTFFRHGWFYVFFSVGPVFPTLLL